MDELNKAPARTRHAFPPSHPRYGGRKPGSKNKRTVVAWELVEKLERELGKPVNPLEALLRTSVDESVSLDTRIDCAKSALPFLFPRLQSTALTNAEGDGPVEVATLDVSYILADPKLTAMAHDLAMAMVAPETQLAQPHMPKLLLNPAATDV